MIGEGVIICRLSGNVFTICGKIPLLNRIRFVFAIHNHQPVGNFGHVLEQAYQESYLPFLDVFEGYNAVKLTLHTSGSLVEWLAEEHPA